MLSHVAILFPIGRTRHAPQLLLSTGLSKCRSPVKCFIKRFPKVGPEKNRDSQRRDRILRLFLCPDITQISPHFWAISLPKCTANLEKKVKKSTGENSKNPVEKIPRNCRFLSLVVVERVLKRKQSWAMGIG